MHALTVVNGRSCVLWFMDCIRFPPPRPSASLILARKLLLKAENMKCHHKGETFIQKKVSNYFSNTFKSHFDYWWLFLTSTSINPSVFGVIGCLWDASKCFIRENNLSDSSILSIFIPPAGPGRRPSTLSRGSALRFPPGQRHFPGRGWLAHGCLIPISECGLDRVGMKSKLRRPFFGIWPNTNNNWLDLT